MKFIRQFVARKPKANATKKKKNATVQGAILSNQKLAEKLLQGNLYGITLNAKVDYDYDDDDKNFDENSVVHLDRSDRLISLVQMQNRASYLQNKKKIALAEAVERKVAELIQKATPETDVAK